MCLDDPMLLNFEMTEGREGYRFDDLEMHVMDKILGIIADADRRGGDIDVDSEKNYIIASMICAEKTKPFIVSASFMSKEVARLSPPPSHPPHPLRVKQQLTRRPSPLAQDSSRVKIGNPKKEKPGDVTFLTMAKYLEQEGFGKLIEEKAPKEKPPMGVKPNATRYFFHFVDLAEVAKRSKNPEEYEQKMTRMLIPFKVDFQQYCDFMKVPSPRAPPCVCGHPCAPARRLLSDRLATACLAQVLVNYKVISDDRKLLAMRLDDIIEMQKEKEASSPSSSPSSSLQPEARVEPELNQPDDPMAVESAEKELEFQKECEVEKELEVGDDGDGKDDDDNGGGDDDDDDDEPPPLRASFSDEE